MATTTNRPDARAGRRTLRLFAPLAAIAAIVLLASGCVIDGAWTATAPIQPVTPGTAAGLMDVSCVSEDWCLAGGRAGTAPVAQIWDGATWTSAPAPPSGPSGGSVYAVECGAPDLCLAATVRSGYSPYENEFVVAWNGLGWVDALGWLSADDGVTFGCAADGCVISHAGDESTYRWDGETAELVAGSDSANGASMSCRSADDCVAAGWGTSTWDGTVWTQHPTDFSRQFKDIDCAASTNKCVGVGIKRISGSNFEPVGGTWNGSTWTLEAVPYPSLTQLTDVSCASNSECVALGEPMPGVAGSTYSEYTWNGADWYVAPTPPGSAAAAYAGISCAPLWCMAVGYEVPATSALAATYTWTNS